MHENSESMNGINHDCYLCWRSGERCTFSDYSLTSLNFKITWRNCILWLVVLFSARSSVNWEAATTSFYQLVYTKIDCFISLIKFSSLITFTSSFSWRFFCFLSFVFGDNFLHQQPNQLLLVLLYFNWQTR